MVAYAPDKGDIVWLDFEPRTGSEITKTRPALVISPKKYNSKTNLAIMMPITSQKKEYPFEIDLVTEKVKGVILCDQIRSLDWKARNAKKITKVSQEVLTSVLNKVMLLLE